MFVDKMTHSIVKRSQIIVLTEEHNISLPLLHHLFDFSLNNRSIQFWVVIIGFGYHLFPLFVPLVDLRLAHRVLEIKCALAVLINCKGYLMSLAHFWRHLDVVVHEVSIEMNGIRMHDWLVKVISFD